MAVVGRACCVASSGGFAPLLPSLAGELRARLFIDDLIPLVWLLPITRALVSTISPRARSRKPGSLQT